MIDGGEKYSQRHKLTGFGIKRYCIRMKLYTVCDHSKLIIRSTFFISLEDFFFVEFLFVEGLRNIFLCHIVREYILRGYLVSYC